MHHYFFLQHPLQLLGNIAVYLSSYCVSPQQWLNVSAKAKGSLCVYTYFCKALQDQKVPMKHKGIMKAWSFLAASLSTNYSCVLSREALKVTKSKTLWHHLTLTML